MHAFHVLLEFWDEFLWWGGVCHQVKGVWLLVNITGLKSAVPVRQGPWVWVLVETWLLTTCYTKVVFYGKDDICQSVGLLIFNTCIKKIFLCDISFYKLIITQCIHTSLSTASTYVNVCIAWPTYIKTVYCNLTSYIKALIYIFSPINQSVIAAVIIVVINI